MPARKKKRATPAAALRDGATIVQVFNSGLEVWLYDEANRERIIASGAMELDDDAALAALFRAGDLMAYSLWQDDAVHAAVIVGAPLTAEELAVAEWLEPQHAYLVLPSGELCVESNDAARILPEGGSDEGARIRAAPGHYRVTLHRIDDEALERAGRAWDGPREVIVLTPGGTAADAATEILPFVARRDLSWVGQVTVRGAKADALCWFSDPLDTAVVNLDATTLAQLGATPGRCLRLTVPKAKLTMTMALAANWKEGATLLQPAELDATEWGYGSVTRMGEWGVDALFVRRERGKVAVKAKLKNSWLPCTVERLELVAAPPARVRGEVLLDAGKRVYWRGTIADRHYYPDPQVLTAKLFSRVDGVGFGDMTSLDDALARVDGEYAKAGLHPVGDLQFDVARPTGAVEYTNRIYFGRPDLFGVLWTSRDVFEAFYYSETTTGEWILTGTISQAVAKAVSENPRLHVRHFPLRINAGLAAHEAHVASVGQPLAPAPATFEDAVAAYERYLAIALG
ncbi:MAG: hypothetical protein HY275_12775 [Gemmatimonadetes bacterium]|nr:hypothetical protein [Gemmatimonadota bacterium]